MMAMNGHTEYKLDLRRVAAVLVDPNGEITHQTVKNRRIKTKDTSVMTIRWLDDLIKIEGEKQRYSFALRQKRLEYVREYYSRVGKFPSPDDIRKELPFENWLTSLIKENNNEQ